jgi:hypothetical protein
MLNSSNGKKTTSDKMLELLKKLIKNEVITSEKVYNAIAKVDRGDFIDSYYAYDDW